MVTQASAATKTRARAAAHEIARDASSSEAARAARQAAVESDPRWQAVVDRDESWGGVFVLGVGSTGIYCRPGCPARRPRAEVVTFFDEPDIAEEAGFRACKRCIPKQPPERLSDVERVRRVCRFVQTQADQSPSTAQLTRLAGLHPRRLQRVFQRHVGLSPGEFADACRVSRFKGLVRNGTSVTDAVYEAGYGSSSRLYESAGRSLGMTPGTYAKGGASQRIRFASVESQLGRVLVGATDLGVCTVYIGDDEASLVDELAREFSGAELSPETKALRPWLQLLVRHLEGEAPAIELPLDLRPTAFQRRVWQALQSIPRGETRTYSGIAAELGQPKAARAVGNACARNPVSIAVPCHRAVREDGGLGGYRWGLDRKRALLAGEQANGGRR